MIITLTDEYSKRGKAASIEGAYFDFDTKAWKLDLDLWPSSAAMAVSLFPDVWQTVTDAGVNVADLTEAYKKLPDYAGPFAEGMTREQMLPNVPAELRDKLYEFQAVDAHFIVARARQDGGGYFGWSRGLGKTLVAITVLHELLAKHAIIVTPNSSKYTVWGPEFDKWAPGKYDVLDISGTKKDREYTVSQWFENVVAGTPTVMLVHYEALRLIDWDAFKPDVVICDEAHRMANCAPRGNNIPKFYKALRKIEAKYRIALSGSIIVNGPSDFFGANSWALPQHYRSKWKDWNDRWMQYVPGTFEIIGVRPDRLEEMQHELATFMVVRRKEDELPDLPDKIYQPLYVKLSAAQQKVYDEMAEHFIAELPDGEIIFAPNVVSQIGKLRGIAAGLDAFGEVQDSSKMNLALELVQDNLPKQTVVFCWHRAIARSFYERVVGAGIACGVVDGGVPVRSRTKIVSDFQKGDLKVIVATIKTLGESVTLHSASDLIFLESSWGPTDMEQAEDRIHRIGQKDRVTITSIYAQDTVDVNLVLPRVEHKTHLRNFVLGGRV